MLCSFFLTYLYVVSAVLTDIHCYIIDHKLSTLFWSKAPEILLLIVSVCFKILVAKLSFTNKS